MKTSRDTLPQSQSSVHLDAIRGAAALVVLMGHTRNLFFASLTGEEPTTMHGTVHASVFPRTSNGLPSTITIGNEAVMVFFVLSGYLVGGSVFKDLRRNTWSWKNYCVKRMTRLWVVLLPALLLGVALDYAGLHSHPSASSIYRGPVHQAIVPTDVASRLSVKVLVANALFLQGVFARTAGTNESLWSLANEFWYYLAFPALLLATREKQKVWLRSIYSLLVMGIAILVGRTIFSLFFVWVLGALLSTIPLKLPISVAKWLAYIMVAGLPVVFVLVRKGVSPYGAEWIVALTFSFTLYLLLHQKKQTKNGVYRRLAAFFSRISYTLYLVHLPLAVFLCAYVNDPWHIWAKSLRNLLIFVAFNALIVLVAYVLHLAFEANTEKVRSALLALLQRFVSG